MNWVISVLENLPENHSEDAQESPSTSALDENDEATEVPASPNPDGEKSPKKRKPHERSEKWKYTRKMPSQRRETIREKERQRSRLGIEPPAKGFPGGAAIVSYRFKCEICDAEFRKEPQLVIHKLMHDEHFTDDGTISKNCPACNVIAISLEELAKHVTERHRRRESNSAKRKFPCPTCRHHFSSENARDLHVERMHSENSEAARIFQCEICKEKLLTKAGWTSHMKVTLTVLYFSVHR